MTVPPSTYQYSGGTSIAASIAEQLKSQGVAEVIHHPPHYTAGGIETIDYIDAKGFGYHLASVIKYVSRAGRKSPATYVEDLRKAAWYLQRAIQVAESKDLRTSRT